MTTTTINSLYGSGVYVAGVGIFAAVMILLIGAPIWFFFRYSASSIVSLIPEPGCPVMKVVRSAMSGTSSRIRAIMARYPIWDDEWAARYERYAELGRRSDYETVAIFVAPFGELFPAVLHEGLELGEAKGLPVGHGDHQRLVDEGLDEVGDVVDGQVVAGAGDADEVQRTGVERDGATDHEFPDLKRAPVYDRRRRRLKGA